MATKFLRDTLTDSDLNPDELLASPGRDLEDTEDIEDEDDNRREQRPG